MSDRALFLETAGRIGARLCRDAIWDRKRCNWLGDSMEFYGGKWTAVHRSFGADLYSGTSGIALSLARLHQFTAEPLYRSTAMGALEQAFSRMDAIPVEMRVSAFSGWSGIARACLDAGEALGDGALTARGLDILSEVAGMEPGPDALDTIGGAAGAIRLLADAARRFSKPSLLEGAVRFGDLLIARANRSDAGWSWTTLPGSPQAKDLTGLSHGAAGIALALLELSAATGESRFTQAAQCGFAYERHWYSPQHKNWPDLRDDLGAPAANAGPAYSVTWCHGAPGITLSRLRAFELTADPVAKEESEAGLETTRLALLQAAAAGQNYSLCHGSGGNAEPFIVAAGVFEDPSRRAIAEQVGQQGAEIFERQGLPWPCGVNMGGETPGLMLGLAGIAHFYLRLYDPAAVRPVLI